SCVTIDDDIYFLPPYVPALPWTRPAFRQADPVIVPVPCTLVRGGSDAVAGWQAIHDGGTLFACSHERCMGIFRWRAPRLSGLTACRVGVADADTLGIGPPESCRSISSFSTNASSALCSALVGFMRHYHDTVAAPASSSSGFTLCTKRARGPLELVDR